MERTETDLPARLFAALERLASRPVTLLCLLLLANAVAAPYRGLLHDARLYAAQVRERVEPGSMAQDLFLEYGSQDRYSAFTALVAPAAAAVGVLPAFFAGYLLAKALFFWALLRLVFALVPDRAAAVLALLFLAVAPLPFGSNEIFHLNEPFFTPRPVACALVLFAVERALAGRAWQAVPLLAGAFALHPLMALGGALTLLLWGALAGLRPKALAALAAAAALAGAAVVLYRPLGARVFGHLDEEWRGVIMDLCFFIHPSAWSRGDWVRVGCCAGVTVAAAFSYARGRSALLLALLSATGLGFVGTVVAMHTRYLLLYQSSPYRTLWLLELLAVPLAFWGAVRWWRRGAPLGRCAALALLLLVTADSNGTLLHPAALFAGLLPVAVVYYRGLGRAPARPDWLAESGTAAFVACAALLLAFNVGVVGVLFCQQPRWDLDVHPAATLQAAGTFLYKLPVVLTVAAAGALVARARGGWRLPAALAGCWLAYQAGLTYVAESAWYTERYTAGGPHQRFVTDFLKGRAAGRGAPLTVYWAADLGTIWFQADAHSYLNPVQLSGCAFNRGTAVEGRRRSRLVAPFEVAKLRREPLVEPWWQDALERFYRAHEVADPTPDDLLALCADPRLDFVVLEEGFDGLYAATDGRFYVYDCARLRDRDRPAGRCRTDSPGLR